jgi:hypothetical protein
VVVNIFSFIVGILFFAGMGIGYGISYNQGLLDRLFDQPWIFVIIPLAILVCGWVLSGVHILAATASKSYRQGYIFALFIILMTLLIGVATLIMQPKDFTLGLMFVPMVNVIGLVRMLISGIYDFGHVLACLSSCIVYSVVLLGVSSGVFWKREQS